MWPIILGSLFLSALVAIYIILFYANKNTKIPEGSIERHEEAQGCTACGSLNKFTVPKDVIEKFKEEHL